ncbi:MAG TPA: exodeoxyribonuclease III [Candidatus Nanoarchaeia archaeon]|nr:exodeoxyribonuclease III [Candidatus Nanoarchaeia archaeon]
MHPLKLISWNVNGIRACMNKGFLDFFRKEDPDMICLQEIKAEKEQVNLELPDYHQFWNSAKKKGYSGTAIFTKHKPLNVSYGLGIEEHDQEGRVITLELPEYNVVTVYTPNAQENLARLPYRMRWDKAFLAHVKKLEDKKPVIFCGDLNVAHKEIDLARPNENRKNPGFSDEERAGFDNIVGAGFIDTFRHFDQSPQNYSWWSMRTNARARNVGWRIDYVVTSESLKSRLKSASILPQVHGSDHCPVSLVLK